MIARTHRSHAVFHDLGYVIIVDERIKPDIGKTIGLCPSILFSTVSMQWATKAGVGAETL